MKAAKPPNDRPLRPLPSDPSEAPAAAASVLVEPQAPASGPPHKVPLYYDGSLGSVRVTLRDAGKALSFDTSGCRTVSAADAQDLLTPAIGGGVFYRVLELAAAEVRFAVALDPGEKLTLTLISYQLPGDESHRPFLVLDRGAQTLLARQKGAAA